MSGSGILIPADASPSTKKAWMRLQTVLNAHESSITSVQSSSAGAATAGEIASLQAQITALQNIVNNLSAGGVFNFNALSSMSAYTVVYEFAKGSVSPCDNTVPGSANAIAGITLANVSSGNTAKVAGSGYTVTSGVWSWSPGAPVFVGVNGFLTQDQPTPAGGAAYSCLIGWAVTAQSVLIDIGEPEFFATDNEGPALVRSAAGQLQQALVPLLPSMSEIAAGAAILVPAGYNLLYSSTLGLTIRGMLEVRGNVVGVSP